MSLNLKSIALNTILGLACAPVGGHFYLHPKQAPPEIYLQQFAAPPYAPLARLAGIEGEVHVQYGLDGQCNIASSKLSGGPGELTHAVLDILDSGPEMKFSGCDGEPTEVHVVFRFALEGEPTNQWAPTHLRLAKPFTIELSTSPPDLKSLGLARVPRPGARD